MSARAPFAALLLLGWAAALATLAAHHVALRGRVQPGVHVAGVAVGGLTPSSALLALAAAGYDPAAPVRLHAGDVTWSLDPATVGVAFDARATVAAAYGVGRGDRSAILAAVGGRLFERSVPPRVSFQRDTARAAMERLADDFDRPASNASLVIEPAAVHATAAVEGRALNVEGALAVLAAAAAAGRWPIDRLALPTNTIEPAIRDAEAAARSARALLAAPVHMRHRGHMWTLEPAVAAAMLTTTASSGTLALAVRDAAFADWMTPVIDVVSSPARAPRFRFAPDGPGLQLLSSGAPEVRVDLTGTARRLLEIEAAGSRTLSVAVRQTPAEPADDASALELGIRELVWEETSRFVGSPPERVHNIAVSTARFDGLLVPPDAVVSFNDSVGDITAEEGYQETLIIMDGTTTDGVGGGVCQVSTTLFRAALKSGLPIVERFAHGYRVAYYEQGADPGLDATVYKPVVDLKFRNDTGAWLLIETETDPRAMTVTFRFYGTLPEREIEILAASVGGHVAPPPARVVLDAGLSPGASRILEHARAGASVSVTRVIREAGEERRETFYSRYRPTGLVTAVSPAAVAPPPADGPGLETAPEAAAAAIGTWP